MADLVEREFHPLAQLAGRIERIGLEEEADPVAGIEEPSVLGVALVVGGKNGAHAFGVESGHEVGHPGPQAIADCVGDEALEQHEPIALVACANLVREYGRHRLSRHPGNLPSSGRRQ